VKVVILGQDPYHGPGQAHGLSFSVKEGVKFPPSLRNMFKAIALDYPDTVLPQHGDLTAWAQQGVLLLNTVLTVEQGKAHSHASWGWETFTDTVIKKVSEATEHVVFLLWGSHAQKKIPLIDGTKHYILTAPHPSPLSAHRGFFDANHFKKANDYLQQHGRQPIKWA
jgi:uracil-DNA glycosylase